MTHYLIFLALIPIASFQLCRMFAPGRLWLWTGLTVGAVIAPVSQGLVEYTMIPLIGGMLGLMGAIFNMIHGSVGYFLLAACDIFQPGAVLDGSQLTMMNLVNGAIWTIYYGLVGYRIDVKAARKTSAKYVVVGAAKLKHGEEF
ncbi:MAG: hypothetical protein C0613_02920 [Desulfobulbaceae bacterium]|nr:MAG: hypothetical protein C0613_02920 [Desulfobulbaceae bacterium]